MIYSFGNIKSLCIKYFRPEHLSSSIVLYIWHLFYVHSPKFCNALAMDIVFYQHVQTNYLDILEISFQESRLKVSEQTDTSFLTHTNTQRCLLIRRRVSVCVCCTLQQRQENKQTLACPLDSSVFS